MEGVAMNVMLIVDEIVKGLVLKNEVESSYKDIKVTVVTEDKEEDYDVRLVYSEDYAKHRYGEKVVYLVESLTLEVFSHADSRGKVVCVEPMVLESLVNTLRYVCREEVTIDFNDYSMEIESVLIALGLKSKLKGYNYILTGINYALNEDEVKIQLKDIYWYVGRKYRIPIKNVERNLRVCLGGVDLEAYKSLMGVCSCDRVPSVKEFMATLRLHIQSIV